MHKYFADVVGARLEKSFTDVSDGANLLLIALLIFVAIMVAFSIAIYLIRKKGIKDKDTWKA